MVIAEIFSWAELPWTDVPETQIIPKILNREKLVKSELCPDAVYEVMLSCWKIGLMKQSMVICCFITCI